MTASPNVSGEPEWTVDDVRHLPEDLHYELIGGRLMLSPPVLPFHQVLSLQTATALTSPARRRASSAPASRC
jgi:hypothetical protein